MNQLEGEMFKIESHKFTEPTRHLYFLNDVEVGTTIEQVAAQIPSGVPRKTIRIVCQAAKNEKRPFVIYPGVLGWLVR